MDADQLTDKFVGIKGIGLKERLYQIVRESLTDEKQLISKINAFFESLTLHPVSTEVIKFLNRLDFKNPISIGDITREIGVSERSLERKFKMEVGLSPKKYIQIRRVFNVFEKLKSENDWQQIVIDHSYADQSHLITEFKKYANIAPGIYVRKGLTLAQQLPPISGFEL